MKRRKALGVFVTGMFTAVGMRFSVAEEKKEKKPHCACCVEWITYDNGKVTASKKFK